MRSFAAACTCIALLGLVTPVRAGLLWDSDEEKAEKRQQELLRAQTHFDALRRVHNTLYRLGAVGSPLCEDDVRPLYGLHVTTISDIESSWRAGAEQLGIDGSFRVMAVAPGSPAEAAGVLVGDKIDAVGVETAQSWRSTEGLFKTLDQGKVGQATTFSIKRGGGTQNHRDNAYRGLQVRRQDYSGLSP